MGVAKGFSSPQGSSGGPRILRRDILTIGRSHLGLRLFLCENTERRVETDSHLAKCVEAPCGLSGGAAKTIQQPRDRLTAQPLEREHRDSEGGTRDRLAPDKGCRISGQHFRSLGVDGRAGPQTSDSSPKKAGGETSRLQSNNSERSEIPLANAGPQ
jgi:hypothetical protein